MWMDFMMINTVENAIRNHSEIDQMLKYGYFCNILRDADKVDIFRVNVDTPAEDYIMYDGL